MKQSIATTAIATVVFAVLPLQSALGQDAGGVNKGSRQISLGIGSPEPIDLHGYLGVGVGAFPQFEGSDDMEAAALPLFHIGQPGFLFLRGTSTNPNDGMASGGMTLLHFRYEDAQGGDVRMSLGPLVRYRGGRDEGDNDALSGLGDIDGSVEVGGFLEARAGHWSAEMTVAQDVGGGHEGLLATLGTKYTAPVGKKLTLTTGLSTSWADDDYTQSYFGVSSGQASNSGLARFDGEAGFKDVGVQFGLSYALSPSWSIEGEAGYQRLLNAAADSPIVDTAGSPDQFRVLIGAAYRF